MRRFALILVVAAAAMPARAEVVMGPQMPAPDPDRGNFWRQITDPHRDEINVIVFKAKQAINQAETSLYSDYDPTGEGRMKILREVNGMLRYARRLAPDNLDVLKLYAQTSDELGKTRQAIDALNAAIDSAGIDKAGSEVTGRLGEIYLRLGQLDDAIRYLRAAQGPIVPGQPYSAHVLVHLADALALRGQTTDAIEVLQTSLPTSPAYYSQEMQVAAFALAVLYDRDDQRGLAFETLDKLHASLQEQMGHMVQAALASVRFATPADQQYYLGLLYEAVDNYPEARAQFALYAAAGDLPYRRRALDHVAAIDKLPHDAPTLNLRKHRVRIHVSPPPPPVVP